jgi:branched-chain amino acid transport system ATP-binding protein
MSEPDLNVENLSVRYGPVEAVRSVSLQVERGSVVAIVGANGAGKSSALTALAGICPGTMTGTVRLAGEPLRRKRPHRNVKRGMVLVPEGRRMISPLTVEENLQLGGYRHRSGRRLRELLSDAFELFPILSERRDVPSGLLSGGEQQMLAFGRAMMSDPRLVLMDEPTMGLSPSMTDRVTEAIAAINSRGVSVLLVEQNAAAALSIASYAYVLDRGEVAHEGPAAQVSTDPILAQAFLGLRPTS